MTPVLFEALSLSLMGACLVVVSILALGRFIMWRKRKREGL
jgi:hypothetical protein